MAVIVALDMVNTFEALNDAALKTLQAEHTAGRISTSDYAKVFTQMMQSAQQQAMAFELGRQNADKQAELLAAQKLVADNQVLKLIEETLLVKEQVKLLAAQIVSQVLNDGKVAPEIALLISQELLVDAQKLETDAKTALITQQDANAVIQGTVFLAQELKVDAETALLVQKTRTEEAQILDTVNASTVVGMIGKQKDLYTAQTTGFTRDAEQKILKIVSDTYSVRKSVDTATPLPVGFDTASVDAVITKAKAGIGVV